MAYIKQYTYGVSGQDNTIAADVNLVKGYWVKEIGIYGLPGTSFSVNDNKGTITLNGSGLMSIGFDNYKITNLRIDEDNLELYKDTNHCLIIDILYEGVETKQ